jgi:AcrR family transcriptional regulator
MIDVALISGRWTMRTAAGVASRGLRGDVNSARPSDENDEAGPPRPGRTNQRERTRRAIIEAGRALIESGGSLTMPVVAREAMVSEATAYRYFPDLPSLVRAALVDLWPTGEEALRPVADETDPELRIAFAADELLRRVLAYQGSTRAMIADTIAQPGRARGRPGYRFAFIDEALDPVASQAGIGEEALLELKRQLAVVISPESLFTLIDSVGCSPEEAIGCIATMARSLTRAAIR